MDLKLWEYIFEMFNYKIRQKNRFFSKLQTLTPPLNCRSTVSLAKRGCEITKKNYGEVAKSTQKTKGEEVAKLTETKK